MTPNGCSVPAILRIFIPQETQAQCRMCNRHDVAYERGGTRRDRALADARLLVGLLQTGMDVEIANQYYVAVRLFGKEHWRTGRYTDDPPPERAPEVEAP